MRSPACRTAPCSSRTCASRSSWRKTRPGAWRCCSSRSTASRSSTIRSAPALGDELLRQFSDRLVRCAGSATRSGASAATSSPSILTMTREQQDEAVHLANEMRESLARALRPARPAGRHDRQHRHRHVPGRRRRPGHAGQVCRYGHGARQGSGARRLPLLHGRHERAGAGAARPRTGPARRARGQRSSCCTTSPSSTCRPGACAASRRCCAGTGPATAWCIPAEFVPVLEETGLIVRIGDWIIDEACRQIAAWHAQGVRDVRVAVNVSSRQFVEGDLEGVVRAAIERHAIEPGHAGAGTDRKRADDQCRAHHRGARAAQGARHPDRDRRFRHRLLEPGLPEALPDRQAQDRHRLRARHRHQPGRRGHRAGHHQHGAQPAHAGDRRRASRRAPRWRICGATAATRSRASTFRARCRPTSWPGWCARIARTPAPRRTARRSTTAMCQTMLVVDDDVDTLGALHRLLQARQLPRADRRHAERSLRVAGAVPGAGGRCATSACRP